MKEYIKTQKTKMQT